jgi:organic hydroperoxide reductase OsmC/OhrA
MANDHIYQIQVIWTGNRGEGTKDYRSYDRSHSFMAKGKPDLLGSSDPAFRGDPTKWNPEELLLASLSSCHMLWYLHLCADHKIVVTDYQDQPVGKMKLEKDGKGYFEEATLNPVVTITDPASISLAETLHTQAHEKCFIANSVNFAIQLHPTIISI